METTQLEIMSIPDWKEFTISHTIAEVIEAWHDLPKDIILEYFLHIPHEQQIEFLLHLSQSEQQDLILDLTSQGIKEPFKDIAPDDLVDLFQQVSQEVRDAVWEHLSEEEKKITNFLLRFDYDDAAGIMTPNYVKVRPNITVVQTIAFIRANIDMVETIYYIYIVDAIGRLQGVVSLRDLFRKNDNVLLQDFMTVQVHSVQENTNRKETAELLQEYDLLAIPVLDNFKRLLGIVTVDDAMEVLAEEHNEDMLQMSAITPTKTTYAPTYLDTNIMSLFKSRIPWLAILLIAGTLTSNVINIFSDIINAATYLILFIPVITSTGGNTATQSATLMIRGLSRNELEFRHIFKVVLKESCVALLIGMSLAIIMLLRSLWLAPSIELIEAGIISISLLFVVLFSAMIGVLAPLLISKLGADPTVIVTPLIATLIDVLGLSIYFFMAKLLLS